MVTPSKVLLLTVNRLETEAVLAAFKAETGTIADTVAKDKRTYLALGTVANTTVFHAISEMGSSGPGGAQQTVDIAYPGCWIAGIPAGGLLLMQDAASWCTCSYLNQATLALQPREYAKSGSFTNSAGDPAAFGERQMGSYRSRRQHAPSDQLTFLSNRDYATREAAPSSL